MTVRHQTAADPTTIADPDPLALPFPKVTPQQVFWQIVRQSMAYGVVGGAFSYSVALLFEDRFRFFDLGYLLLSAIGGVIGGLVWGFIAALLTFHIFYPMRSPRLYQAIMFFIPLIMPIISVLISPFPLLNPVYFLLSTFTPSTIYMLWATQRISASVIRSVGVAVLPYDRTPPDILDSYLPEGRRALFDMAPEIADPMEWLVGLGTLARWRGALLARLDLRPGMRVADLMAGTGAMSRALVRQVGAGTVTAVESAPGVAARLRRSAGVAVVEADALANGLPSGEADVVTCAFGTLGLRQADQMRLADEVDRLLAPNGVVGMVDLTLPRNPWLRWAYLWYIQFAVPLAARLFLRHPALYQALPRYLRESVGLAPLAGALGARGYAVLLVPLDGGLATALVAMKPEGGKRES